MAEANSNHIHAWDGGQLVYSHTKTEHGIKKEYYRCQKCGHLVACTTFPSYEQMVLRKQLIVDFPEVKRIKQKYGLWRTKAEMKR